MKQKRCGSQTYQVATIVFVLSFVYDLRSSFTSEPRLELVQMTQSHCGNRKGCRLTAVLRKAQLMAEKLKALSWTEYSWLVLQE